MSESLSQKTLSRIKRFNEIYSVDPSRFQKLLGVTPNWTPTKLITLYREYREKRPSNNTEVAALIDLDRSTVTRKANTMDWEKFEENLDFLCKASGQELLEVEADQERNRLITQESEKTHKVHITNLAMMKHLETTIMEKVKAIPRIKLQPFHYYRKTKKTRTPEHMVLLLSDLHVGQEFSNQDTGHLNEYNLSLFQKRAEYLRKGLVSLYEHHSEIYDIPELHIFCLGDLVQGSNLGGEWGPAYNSTMDVHEQAVTASDTLCDMISVWENYFKKINVFGVIGNHGRAGVAQNSDKVSANWDNMVYALMKAKMKGHSNVDVGYTHSWWDVRTVNNTQFLLLHGDHLKGGVNALYSEEGRLQGLVGQKLVKRFNYLCVGHFHNAMELETADGGIIANGSFVGGDIYSMHKLRHISRPSQFAFGVHPNRGLTWKYKIDLDPKEG